MILEKLLQSSESTQVVMVYFELCILNTSIIKVYGHKFWQFPRLKCRCNQDPNCDIINCSMDYQNELIFKEKISDIIGDYNGRVQAKMDDMTNNIVDKYLKEEQNKLHMTIPTVLSGVIKRYTRISLENIYQDSYHSDYSESDIIVTDIDDDSDDSDL